MVCKGSSWPVPPKRYLSSATWLVAHVIKCYFLLIDTPIAFRYLSTYSHVQNPTYKKGDTHTHTNIMLVEITPYGLSCTYVHVSEFTDFWREALTCTYVHVSMHFSILYRGSTTPYMAVMTEPSGFAVAHGWYLAGVYTGLSKIEVVWHC